ncbi:MAG: DUF423 domain-containing protein [Bacteroidia bacterium]|nr:DUF423 domain-containing protein [Bacteroidia bacterium]
MKKKLLLAGSVFALISVIAGAFGSHALKKILQPEDLIAYETAVRYQMYHAFAILLTGLFMNEGNKKFTRFAGIFFSAGIIFFSGSLFAITFLKASAASIPLIIALATPLGGVLFVCGWALLSWSIFRQH